MNKKKVTAKKTNTEKPATETRGRKSREFIFQENKELILKLTKSGSTDIEIMKVLGIKNKQYYDYKNNDPEFNEILMRAKVKADTEVENSLFKRATGYDILEEHTEVEPDPDMNSKGKIKKVKRIKKHIPGDVTAQIFWLKNRQSNKWRDKQEVEHSIVELEEIKKKFKEAIGG